MVLLYTPTTAFEIMPLVEIDAAMARLRKQKVGCYHDFLQHDIYGVELVSAPPNVCITPDKMYGLAQVTAPEQPGHLALQVKICFGQILSFHVKLDTRSGTMPYYVTVNLYVKHEEFPFDGISMTSLRMVPKSQSIIQTNLVKEYPVLTLHSVGIVHHYTPFTWRVIVGRFNPFGSR
jgi:hypothetical protein